MTAAPENRGRGFEDVPVEPTAWTHARALAHGRAAARIEAEGFAVFPEEWWHFDHKDWPKYPILDKRFEELR